MALKVLRKYGAQATLNFVLFTADGEDFQPGAIHVVGDVTIMKNEGAEVNTTNGFVDEGTGYSIILTATEMEAARIVVYISDQTAVNVWLDDYIVIETYGHVDAQFPVYPADVEKWDAVDVATPDVAGYPLITIKDDTGNTEVARTGADGDTLETLSDQVDGVQSGVEGIQNNTRTVIGLPERFIIPDTGDTVFKITLNFYDTDGNMEDPDDNEFSFFLETRDATDKTSLLYKELAATNPLDASVKFGGYKALERTGVGRYFCYVKIVNTELESQLMHTYACEENSTPLYFSRSNLLTFVDSGVVTLEDSDPNKLIIATAMKDQDIDAVSPISGSFYSDIQTQIDSVPSDLLATLIDGEPVENILKFVRSMSKGRFVKETLPDGDYFTFYLPNATTALFKLKITESERTEVAL